MIFLGIEEMSDGRESEADVYDLWTKWKKSGRDVRRQSWSEAWRSFIIYVHFFNRILSNYSFVDIYSLCILSMSSKTISMYPYDDTDLTSYTAMKNIIVIIRKYWTTVIF